MSRPVHQPSLLNKVALGPSVGEPLAGGTRRSLAAPGIVEPKQPPSKQANMGSPRGLPERRLVTVHHPDLVGNLLNSTVKADAHGAYHQGSGHSDGCEVAVRGLTCMFTVEPAPVASCQEVRGALLRCLI